MQSYLDIAKQALQQHRASQGSGTKYEFPEFHEFLAAIPPAVMDAAPEWHAEEIARRVERQSLLAWASALAEQDLVLAAPVSFIEAPQRPVTTERVSRYAARYLRTITSACIGQETGGWGMWDAAWWRQREQDAIAALEALRDAMVAQQHGAAT